MNIVRLGNSYVNMANVASIRMNTKDYDGDPVVQIAFVGGDEMWFRKKQYQPAANFLRQYLTDVPGVDLPE